MFFVIFYFLEIQGYETNLETVILQKQISVMDNPYEFTEYPVHCHIGSFSRN